VTALQNDVTGLRTDVTTLQNDVTGLRADVTTLQNDVTGLRVDVTTLQNDVKSHRAETSAMEDRLRVEIRAGDEETRRQMRVLHEEVIARIALLQEGINRPRGGRRSNGGTPSKRR
jgi:predicted  nucleic acid-binding Zn-ribbon protein